MASSGPHADQFHRLRAVAIGIAVINATGNIGSARPFMIGWLGDITGSFVNSGTLVCRFCWVVGAPLSGFIPGSARARAPPLLRRKLLRANVRSPMADISKPTTAHGQ
ncbi:hypothetical protein KCP71_22055 [Salmonella enterica subsp. enterica]|nr:hypothetical protein KCP71_22055 [Salmonella enterica subsp. enterica]